MTFKLKVIAGTHRLGGEYKTVEGNVQRIKSGRNINKGETFECETDLSKTFPEKFRRVDITEEQQDEGDETKELYQSMTVAELTKHAKEELGLEVPSNTAKAKLVEMILEAENA